MLRIQDFCDMNKFESIMDAWAKSTGLATVAVGSDGEYISECYNFTEFCIDITRGPLRGFAAVQNVIRKGKACTVVTQAWLILVFRSH